MKTARNWIGLATVLLLIGARTSAEPGQAVRERMAGALSGSQELKAKAEALPANLAQQLGMVAMVEEDRQGEVDKRFARLSDVRAYLKLRPWSEAYRQTYARPWPDVTVDEWPTASDLAELRLLAEQSADSAIQSLAVESLGAMGRVEDAQRIGRLVDDNDPGGPVLGWSREQSSMGWFSQDADPLEPTRTWHGRTVGTYAREAMKLITGHRFDGKDPQGVTFDAWWKTHNLGKEALWYWEQRLKREANATPMMERKEGEDDRAFYLRIEEASKAYRERLHKKTIAELGELPQDTQIKIFLLTGADGSGVDVNGPANAYFPEGLGMLVGAGRLRELIAGQNLWPDFGDVPFGRAAMLGRLAREMDEITRGYGAPGFFKAALVNAINKEARGGRRFWFRGCCRWRRGSRRMIRALARDICERSLPQQPKGTPAK